jgi:hypothetical protein
MCTKKQVKYNCNHLSVISVHHCSKSRKTNEDCDVSVDVKPGKKLCNPCKDTADEKTKAAKEAAEKGKKKM